MQQVDPEAAFFLLETRILALDFLIFLVLVSVLASDAIVVASALDESTHQFNANNI